MTGGDCQLPAGSTFQLAEKRIRYISEILLLDIAIVTVEPMIGKYVVYFKY
jgi:hypothetical protein